MALFLMRPTTENYEITHTRKFWTHKTPTRKNLGPTKYPRQKIFDPRNTDEGTMYDGTKPTMVRDPQNLAHSKTSSF